MKSNKQKYKAVLFDLDGTLTDSEPGIMNSFRYALEKASLPIGDEALRRFIGPPLETSFSKGCHLEGKALEKAISDYRDYYSEKGIWENEPYEGIRELLTGLKNEGIKLALATSKPEVFAKRILEHFELIQFFDVIVGSSLDGTFSQKKDIIEAALRQLNLEDTKAAIMVGDRSYDIEGAISNGIDVIGAYYGYGKITEYKKALGIARNVNELSGFLLSNQALIAYAREDDISEIIRLLKALATYEKRPQAVKITSEGLYDILFNQENAHAFILRKPIELVGFAVYYTTVSTFSGDTNLYIEDLYIDPKDRKAGYGRRIFDVLSDLCKVNGWNTIQWSCLSWNKPSREFYEHLGAKLVDEWVHYELKLDNLPEDKE